MRETTWDERWEATREGWAGRIALAMEPKANKLRNLPESTNQPKSWGREIDLLFGQSRGKGLKKKKSKPEEAVREGMTVRGSKLHPRHWDWFLKQEASAGWLT